MKNNFLTSFQILKDNMLYIQPLLFYILLIMMAPAYLFSKIVLPFPKICIIISIFLLTSAFLAGWLYINKQAVLDYSIDDDKETVINKSIKNFKMYFQGVGENFFRVLGSSVIVLFIYMISIYKLGLIYIGHSSVFSNLINLSAKSHEDLINYINTTSLSEQLIFVKWIGIYVLFIMLMHFFAVLYFTITVFEKNNIFCLLIKTLTFIFKNILGCIGIIAGLFLIYILINIISVLCGVNSFAFAVSIILLSLYLNYYILLVFCFYNDKTKSNSDNGPELIG